MARIRYVPLRPQPLDRLSGPLERAEFERFVSAAEEASRLLHGRVVWNLNSTPKGGGVADMLAALLPYVLGAGVDTRWAVIDGAPEFFQITKRLHNRLHGSAGDGGALGPEERQVFEAVQRDNAAELSRIAPTDVVILHDPQTAGLVPLLRSRCAHIVWRCHIGVDVASAVTRSAWEFLTPYLKDADAYVFSKRAFAWDTLAADKVAIIAPSIDAVAPKNIDLSPRAVAACLGAAGIVAEQPTEPATFVRDDGTVAPIAHRARHVDTSPPPSSARLVVQVSRWDRLKDPIGVLEGFAEHVAPATDAHLLLAGPDVEGVPDDPEQAEVLAEVQAAVLHLDPAVRARIHLVCLPMVDVEENAILVNALQRHATVIVQKSLAEGFGLTVTEAMWKARPVVASRVGGISEQIVDGVSGLLVDPRDLSAFGRAVVHLLTHPDEAERVSRQAQRRVRDEFLAPRHLTRYIDLIERLIAR